MHLELSHKKTTLKNLKTDLANSDYRNSKTIYLSLSNDSIPLSLINKIKDAFGNKEILFKIKNGFVIDDINVVNNNQVKAPWKVSYSGAPVKVTEIDTNAKNPWAIKVGEAKEIKFTSGVLSKYKSKLTVNGIKCEEDCFFNFTKKQVEGLILGNTSGEKVASFIIKLPGKQSVIVRGHKISKKAIDLIKAAKVGTVIQLFNIKSGKAKFKPVLITLLSNISKLIDNSPKLNKGEKSNILPPPMPSKPNLSAKESHKIKTYADHLNNKKYKDTKVFWKGKEISKPEALKLVKSSPSINIISEEQPDGSYIILISKEGDVKIENPIPSKVYKIKSAQSFTFSSLKNAKKIEWNSKLKDAFKDLNNDDQIMVVVEIEERVVLNNTIIEGFSTKLKGTVGEIDTMYKKIQEIMTSLKPTK